MSAEPVADNSLLSILEGDERELLRKLALLRSEIADVAPQNKQNKWLVFGDLLRARGAMGTRFPTGLPGLDEKLEGGLFRPSLITVQGRPGIGKTLLATQIALSLGRHCAVAALYKDEGPLGAAVTIGQQLGFRRVGLMKNDPTEQAGAEAALRELCPHWHFLNPSSSDATVEFLAEDFQQMVPDGMPQVWLLDSAQVLPSRGTSPNDKQRDRVMRVYAAAREAALRRGALVLMISKANRASYANKNDEDNVDPLAAGMDSADVEYQSEAIFHLQGKPTKLKPRARLFVGKNRVSAEGDFFLPLQLDYDRKRYLEVDVAHEEADEAIAMDDQARADASVALAVLQRQTRLSTRAWREAAGVKSQRFETAKKRLVATKAVCFEEGTRGGLLWRPNT